MNSIFVNYSEEILQYSCANDSSLSSNSVTSRYWVTSESSATALATAVVSLCFMVIGLPSNLLIIIGIFRHRLYTQPTYIFLLNLTICDLLMCALVMPFTVASGFAGEFIFGSNDKMRCRICQLGLSLVLFAVFSLYALAALSVDRFIFIKYPLKYYKIITPARAITIMCCFWLLSLLLSILPLFEFGEIIFQKMLATCFMRFISETRLAPNFYYVIVVAITALLPLTLILISNIWIICIVQKHIRKIYSIRRASQSKEDFMKVVRKKLYKAKHQKQMQLMKVFGAIVITNFLTWIPVILRCLLASVSGTFSEWWHFAIYNSLISFSVIHPIIQAFLIPEMKIYLTLILKKIALWWHHGSPYSVHSCLSQSDNSNNESSSSTSGGCRSFCCDIFNATLVSVRNEINDSTTV